MKDIDLGKIPRCRRDPKYPYTDWADIKQGKAREVTHLLNGQPARTAQITICCAFRRLGLGLGTKVRGERIWIVRRQEPAS